MSISMHQKLKFIKLSLETTSNFKSYKMILMNFRQTNKKHEVYTFSMNSTAKLQQLHLNIKLFM